MAPTERVFPAAPRIGAGGRLEPSPIQFALTGSERLCLTVFGIATTATLELTVRAYRELDGQIVVHRERVPLTSIVVTGTTAEYPLSAGALLNARLGIPEAGVPPGLVFARLQLESGSGADPTVLATLLQGYVSSRSDLAYPGSPIESSQSGRGYMIAEGWTVNNTLGRASFVVPAKRRCKLLGGRISLTTGATVADRIPLTEWRDGAGAIVFRGVAPPAQPASTTRNYNIIPGLGPSDLTLSSEYHLPWPDDLYMTEDQEIRIVIGNFNVGDTITAGSAVYQEFLDI